MKATNCSIYGSVARYGPQSVASATWLNGLLFFYLFFFLALSLDDRSKKFQRNGK